MDSLLAVTVVSLDKHDLLGDVRTLLDGTETEDVCDTGVGLFVTEGDTHTTTRCDIKSCEFAVLVDDGNEAHIVRKDVNVVLWRDDNSDLELGGMSAKEASGSQTFFLTFLGR